MGRVVDRSNAGAAPHHESIVGNQVLVAVHGSGQIVALNRQGKPIATLPVGAGPHGIAAVPLAS